MESAQNWEAPSISELINDIAYRGQENINYLIQIGLGIQGYIEGSNEDAVIGIAGGYKGVLGLSFEHSLSYPSRSLEFSIGVPDTVTQPGVGRNIGINHTSSKEVMVAVPSLISTQYLDKNELATDYFNDLVENGAFRYSRPESGSPYYAPDSISQKMFNKGYIGFDFGLEKPFEEWKDGWPFWENPNYVSPSQPCTIPGFTHLDDC